jgi:HAD superfamily hydrolase (TIGR01549 family)
MSYRAVLFDLFDTLVLFERSRLPEVRVNGKVIRSTAGRLHAALRPFAPAVPLQDFVAALLWSWQEAERIRSETHREVPAPERFGMLFGRLGLDAGRLAAEALPLLLETHMRELAKAAVFPAHHARLLRALGRRYRLAVVSNFDYAPTARYILEREGVAALFDTVVVSDEVGWRKPKPAIFEAALRRLGLAPVDALFVGDRPDIDVAGAQGAGMASAWINRNGAALPEGIRPPDFELRDLAELGAILGIESGPGDI